MKYIVVMKKPFGKSMNFYADKTADLKHLASKRENAYLFANPGVASMTAQMFNSVLMDAMLSGAVNVPRQRFVVESVEE